MTVIPDIAVSFRISQCNLYSKNNKPDLTRRFLFLTGDVVAFDFLPFMEEHKVSCISKPFEVQNLISSINDLFQLRERDDAM